MRITIIEPKGKDESQRKRVCTYARVSTHELHQGESLENQITYYRNLIQSSPDYEFIRVFADLGVSGTTDKRPEFQNMLKLAKEGGLDLILTKSVSRFARNTAIVLEVVRELKGYGVDVIFEKENISTLTGDGELMLTVLSSFAQEESKSVSDNIKWRIRKNFEEGKVMVNHNRFRGYTKDEEGNLVIREEEARVVRHIFEEYLKGLGAGRIAKLLTREGIPTYSGAPWNETTVMDILKNEKYKGDALLQKFYIADHLTKARVRNQGEKDQFYVKDSHPAIIPGDIWEQVQEERARRAKARGIQKGNKELYARRYPLSGMLYCGHCGSPLKRRVWNAGTASGKIVWQCSRYVRNGKAACPGTSIEDDLAGSLGIQEKTIVKEEMQNGERHYTYTSKEEPDQPGGSPGTQEDQGRGLLQGFDGPGGSAFQL